jgi:ADP-ribose pyrophosphatase
MTRDDVRPVAADLLHRGFFRLERLRYRHRRHDGTWSGEVARELLRVGTAVLVVPYDPDADALVVLEQFRTGAWAAGRENCWLTEVVAGLVEEGEAPEATAAREVREEAGLEPLELVHVRRWLSSPGISDENVELYVARVRAGEAGGLHGLESEGEDIRVRVVPAGEASALAAGDLVDNAHSILALMEFARLRDGLRARWAAARPPGASGLMRGRPGG